MDFEQFRQEYQSRFRKLTPDEVVAWPKRIEPLHHTDVETAFKTIEGKLLDGSRQHHPKIWEIEHEARRAKGKRLGPYTGDECKEPCAHCSGTGQMWFCGNLTKLPGGLKRWHIGEYDFDKNKVLAGAPHGSTVICVCQTGRDNMKSLAATVFRWRVEEMGELADVLGARVSDGMVHEEGMLAQMWRRWKEAASRAEGGREEDKALPPIPKPSKPVPFSEDGPTGDAIPF